MVVRPRQGAGMTPRLSSTLSWVSSRSLERKKHARRARVLQHQVRRRLSASGEAVVLGTGREPDMVLGGGDVTRAMRPGGRSAHIPQHDLPSHPDNACCCRPPRWPGGLRDISAPLGKPRSNGRRGRSSSPPIRRGRIEPGDVRMEAAGIRNRRLVSDTGCL